MSFDGVRSEPGGRSPAPGPLRLVQRFVNTVDLEGGPELIGDAAALRDWLVAAGVLDRGERVSAAAHGRALELREAIRALAAAHAGAPDDARAAAVVSAAAARARLRPVLHDASTMRLEPETGGVDGALGRIVAAIQDAIVEGTWPRLKACDRHSCRWAFYDRSKNQSSHWCSTATCGSREKNRRAYRRRRAAARAGSD
jgi:predicted RNA-binding Zn ribbon-like protein